MSSRSLNEILIQSPTELFDLVFAAYNLSFISPQVVCLRLYAKGRCTRFQQKILKISALSGLALQYFLVLATFSEFNCIILVIQFSMGGLESKFYRLW